MFERKLDNAKPCGGAIPPKLIEEFAIPQSLLVARIARWPGAQRGAVGDKRGLRTQDDAVGEELEAVVAQGLADHRVVMVDLPGPVARELEARNPAMGFVDLREKGLLTSPEDAAARVLGWRARLAVP